jgi:hypothetical protein
MGTLHKDMCTFMIIFQTKIVEKIKTQILYLIIVIHPRQSCHLWDNVEKHGTAGQAAGDSFECGLTKVTDTHS